MRCPVFPTFLLLLVRLIYDPWHMDGEWWEDCKYTSFICPLELPADRSNPGNMLSLLSLFPCTLHLWFLNLPFCLLIPSLSVNLSPPFLSTCPLFLSHCLLFFRTPRPLLCPLPPYVILQYCHVDAYMPFITIGFPNFSPSISLTIL
jgi:hypothetical protein